MPLPTTKRLSATKPSPLSLPARTNTSSDPDLLSDQMQARQRARLIANETGQPQFVQFEAPNSLGQYGGSPGAAYADVGTEGYSGLPQQRRPDLITYPEDGGAPILGFDDRAGVGARLGNAPEKVMPEWSPEMKALALEKRAERSAMAKQKSGLARAIRTDRAQAKAMARRQRIAAGSVMNLENQLLASAMQGNPAAVRVLELVANNRNQMMAAALQREGLRSNEMIAQTESDTRRDIANSQLKSQRRGIRSTERIANSEMDLRREEIASREGLARAQMEAAQADPLNLANARLAQAQAGYYEAQANQAGGLGPMTPEAMTVSAESSRALEGMDINDRMEEVSRLIDLTEGMDPARARELLQRQGVTQDVLRELAEYTPRVPAHQDLAERGVRPSFGPFVTGTMVDLTLRESRDQFRKRKSRQDKIRRLLGSQTDVLNMSDAERAALTLR